MKDARPWLRERELDGHVLDFPQFRPDSFDLLVRDFPLLLGQLDEVANRSQTMDRVLEVVLDLVDLGDELAERRLRFSRRGC